MIFAAYNIESTVAFPKSAKLFRSTTAAGMLLLSGFACNQSDARAAADSEASVSAATVPEQVALQAPSAAETLLEGKEAYDEEAFAVEIAAPTAAAVGESIELKIMLAAKNGFKVNAEYPVKFKFGEMKFVKPEKETVPREDAKVEKQRFELPAQVTIEKAGKHNVGGKLSFSVCTDDRCLIEKRDLLVEITAN